jgi:phosphatidylglycerol---prolipoprotein diacylglyceryl transferase
MCPVLFKIGPITVYSFGLMMALGFLIANYFLALDLKRRKLDPAIANNIILIGLVAGIVGSKLLFLIESWSDFVANPVREAFSPSGLTWYGGFILATLCIYWYSRKLKIGFKIISDATSPSLMLGYGVARLGCHFAGDGDYGFPTTLPWGTDYSKGTYPPSVAFKPFPEITSRYPNGIVPDNTPCHPTPVYEFIVCTILFMIMWKYRKSIKPDGAMFALYLILAGAERFTIEFLRINPRLAFGLSEAQLISIPMMLLGTLLLMYYRRTPQTQ